MATLPFVCASGQKKEIAQAKDNVKAGKSLVEAEASMRKLLADSANRDNEKIWLVLFDAVRKQYESLNEQMYLRHSIDTAQFFHTTLKMFEVLEGLDSIDSKPERSGRIHLKYRKRHSEYLNSYRQNLFNGGLYFINNQKYSEAWNFFDAYLDCRRQPLFENYNYSSNDKKLSRAAFYSVLCGYREGSYEHTMLYADLAQGDTLHNETTWKYMAETYRAAKDTANCVEVLQKGFDVFPRSDYFFPRLFDYYFKRGDLHRSTAICDDALAADSLSRIAVYAKSSVMLASKRYDECIKLSEWLIKNDSTASEPYLNVGLSYYIQALNVDNLKKPTKTQRARMIELYRKALPYMKEYRRLVPKAKDKWGLPLYTIYLNLNMGHEFEEIDNLLKQK